MHGRLEKTAEAGAGGGGEVGLLLLLLENILVKHGAGHGVFVLVARGPASRARA